MKRLSVVPILVSVIAMFAIVTLRADVKTREKTLVKLEGVLGGMTRLFGGSAAKDGVVSTVALKGSRKAVMGEATGEIIDLAAERVYRIDVKKKEYKVLTFDQVRKEWQDAQQDAEETAEKLRDAQKDEAEKPRVTMAFTADVKETGQRKPIAGYDTREVILTITGTEQGKTLEQGGGLVMTTTMWLAAPLAAIDEIRAFDLRYMKAIAGDEFAAQAQQQMATLMAMFPSMEPMMQRMREEGGKLRGTSLQTTTVFERVKSAEDAKAAAANTQGGGGGGLGGRLAGRMMGGRGSSSGPRSTVMTTTSEYQLVETSAADLDVAVPAGFKEKK